jgi:tetratricopeptide (TPR) repeat protein
MDAIKTFHTGVSEDFLLKEPEFKGLRDRLLDSASVFYERLGGVLESSTDLDSKVALLDSTYALADLTEKIGRSEESLALHQRVLRDREALAKDPKASVKTKASVGQSMRAVLQLQQQFGPKAEIAGLLDRAMDHLEQLAIEHPEDPEVQNELASLLLVYGGHLRLVENRREEAEIQVDPNALWLISDHAGSYNDLGDVFRSNAKTTEALQAYERSIRLREGAYEKEPENTLLQNHLAWSLRRRGIVLAMEGDWKGAVSDYERSISLWEGLPQRTRDEWLEIGCAYAGLAGVAEQDTTSNPKDAETYLSAAVTALNQAAEMGLQVPSLTQREPALQYWIGRAELRKLIDKIDPNSQAVTP